MTRAPAAIEISVATAASADLVAAFERLMPQLSASAAPAGRDVIAEIIAAPCSALLVARDMADDGKIIGALTLVVFRIPTAVRAWIEDVVVDSSARSQGVGEALTREAVRLAVHRGAQTIDLTSRPTREAARRMYEKIGFAVRDTNVYRYVPSAPGIGGVDPVGSNG